MGDLALVIFFLSMLIVPCCLGVRSIRAEGFTRSTSDGVIAVAEPSEMGEGSIRLREAAVDRQSLALQRSREIYFRSSEGRQRLLGIGAGVCPDC